jgi:hypothetical protein
MIEGGRRSLIAEQPGHLRDRNAGLLDVLERQAVSQTIDDLFVARVLLSYISFCASVRSVSPSALATLCRLALPCGSNVSDFVKVCAACV